jgi:hypothetical protein
VKYAPRRRLHCFPPRSQAEFERCRDRGRIRDDDPPPYRAPGDLENGPASASFDPAGGTVNDTYTLYAANFRPNSTVRVTLTRPDGVTEGYSITTDNSGNGTYTFPRASNPPTGTYTARLTDGEESATARTIVTGGGAAGDPQGPTDDIPESQPQDGEIGGGGPASVPNEGSQCNPARTQLEAELCAQRGE